MAESPTTPIAPTPTSVGPREVCILESGVRNGRLTVVLGRPADPRPEPTAVVTTPATLVAAAQAARWRAARTPLLLVPDGPAHVSLRGVTRTMCDLEVSTPSAWRRAGSNAARDGSTT